MSKFALDLSKFKKIDSNDQTSTLKNQDGHEIKIDHKRLHPTLKKKLDELPLQGKDKTQKFDEGGQAQPSQDINYDKLIPEEQAANAPYGTQPSTDVQALIPNPNNPAGPAPDVSSASQAAQLAPSPPAAPPPPPANPQDQFGIGQYQKEQTQALGQQAAGAIAKEQAEADPKRLQTIATAQQEKQKRDLQAATTYQDTVGGITKSNTELQGAIDSFKLNPQRYVQEMTGGSKIATGLGLILGGFGAGLTHGPNLAFQYLQNQISNDIDAQKTNLGAKESLYSHNLQAMGDARSAFDLSTIHSNIILNNVLDQMKTQTQNPVAQANIQTIQGLNNEKISTLTHGLAVQKALMTSPEGNAQVNPEQNVQNRMQYLRMNGQAPLAEQMEAHRAPGIGNASTPLSADNRADLTAKQNLQNKLGEYIDFAKQNSGSVDPRVAQTGAAKAAELQGLYRQATHGGVYKEGEADFINKVIDPDPSKFFNNIRGVIPKAQELLQSNAGSLKNLKGSLGLPTQSTGQASNLNPQQQKFADWAQKNPNNPKAQIILKKLGMQ